MAGLSEGNVEVYNPVEVVSFILDIIEWGHEVECGRRCGQISAGRGDTILIYFMVFSKVIRGVLCAMA